MVELFLTKCPSRASHGGRPFSFDETDDVVFYEDGMIRVHYSVSGNNQTLLDDLDGTGVPDFVEMTATTANDVLDTYAAMGFVYPLSELDVGLSELGGSTAFDFYLADFGGNADGMFGIDGCSGSACAGYMVLENDFVGYGYPSLQEAVDVLTSHELFHAVQAAYNVGQPSWLSEGGAVWAEWVYNPDVRDFFRFSAAYLSETDRSIYRPPAGMTTSFAYGTGLLFAFWDEYYADETSRMISLQESLVDLPSEDIDAMVFEQMDDVQKDWMAFSRWNLATNIRAGEIESYSFAPRLWGLQSSVKDSIIEDSVRFYPLATTYFELDHQGGECHFVYEGDDKDVRFALYPVVNGDKVGDSIYEWRIGDEPMWTQNLEDGEYWLVGALPMMASNSQKIEFVWEQIVCCLK